MKCAYCEKSEATQKDHFHPRSAGGKEKDNLLPTCRPCNYKKGSGIFWSLESARDFINANSSNYSTWLRKQFKTKIKPHHFWILKKIFDVEPEIYHQQNWLNKKRVKK